MIGAIFATTLLQAFMYPAIYKFGVEKARIGIFIVVFGIAIIGSIIVKYMDFSFLKNTFHYIDNYWWIVTPIIMIIMLYISYKISKRIYLKKEF